MGKGVSPLDPSISGSQFPSSLALWRKEGLWIYCYMGKKALLKEKLSLWRVLAIARDGNSCFAFKVKGQNLVLTGGWCSVKDARVRGVRREMGQVWIIEMNHLFQCYSAWWVRVTIHCLSLLLHRWQQCWLALCFCGTVQRRLWLKWCFAEVLGECAKGSQFR